MSLNSLVTPSLYAKDPRSRTGREVDCRLTSAKSFTTNLGKSKPWILSLRLPIPKKHCKTTELKRCSPNYFTLYLYSLSVIAYFASISLNDWSQISEILSMFAASKSKVNSLDTIFLCLLQTFPSLNRSPSPRKDEVPLKVSLILG